MCFGMKRKDADCFVMYGVQRDCVCVWNRERETACGGKTEIVKGKEKDCVYGNKRKERSCMRAWKTEGDFACMKNGDCVFVEKRGIVCLFSVCS